MTGVCVYVAVQKEAAVTVGSLIISFKDKGKGSKMSNYDVETMTKFVVKKTSL